MQTYRLQSCVVRTEHDLVQIRRKSRQIAQHLGFEGHDQVRIATAVSEIVRNALQHAGSARTEFNLDMHPRPALRVQVSDEGPGISNLSDVLDGRTLPAGTSNPSGGAPVAATQTGWGLVGARRLMDDFEIHSEVGRGTRVVMTKHISESVANLSKRVASLGEELANSAPVDFLDEVRRQHEDLLQALEELRRKESNQVQLNQELEETNRGVVALYAELEEKAETLRRISELKTRFLSNISHEFRTPLSSVLGLTRILMDRTDGELTPEQEHQVRLIAASAQGLLEMVDDLLDLAKVEAGKISIRPAEFRLHALFSTLRGLSRPLVATSDVTLIFQDVDALPPIVSDEAKVAQILRNFLSNALKFTHRGEVFVGACFNETQDEFTLLVRDQGIGIAMEDQQRIFDEFTQIEGPHQKRVKGTGLGLPLSRRLAELLGGSVAVSSEVGHGSTFSVTLPRVWSVPASAETEPGPPTLAPSAPDTELVR